ncbi:MAG: carboxypeptidase-like regulatory domain-containing protein [Nannocystaceae bacterium]
MHIDVLVLNCQTHAVSNVEGRCRIESIPPGDVTVTDFLPTTNGQSERNVKVEAGKALEINFELKSILRSHTWLRRPH